MADTNTLNEPVLTTSQYVQPGVYIGEIIQPTATNLSADARVPAVIAKGSRYAVANNIPLVRAFIQAQTLNFTSSPPFLAPLLHVATGAQALPNRVYTQDGNQLLNTEWKYVLDLNGNFSSIQVRDESYNPLKTYLIDYQSSDRSVQDALPLANVRQIRAVGTQVDRPQYKEFQDFYVPMAFTSVVPDISNVHTDPYFDAVIATLQAGSTGVVTVDSGAGYLAAYSRSYKMTCLAITGTFPNRTATFEWQAVNISGGNEALPPVPLNVAAGNPQFEINEAVPSTLVQLLEQGVLLDFDFGATQFVVGDIFSVNANGASLVEVDARYSNPQFATVSDPALLSGTAGNLLLFNSKDTNYSNARNHNYQIQLVGVSGATPNRSYSFVWARFGDTIIPASGTFTVLENNFNTQTQALSDGIKIDFVFGSASPTVGALWQADAKAPRMYYSAKDSRTYSLNIATASTTGTVVNITGGFNTNTTEGSFGTFSVAMDLASSTTKQGYALLPSNVSVAFRNAPSFAALDLFTFGILDSEVIDWSLEAVITDVRQLTDFNTDMNGAITGTAGLQYVILSQVPSDQDSIRVINYNTNADLSFNFKVGSPFLYFTAPPGVPIQITYDYRGQEPDPGQTYYVTALFLRPEQYYNVPFLVLRLADGRAFAAPSAIDNDLYIGNEIAWNNAAPAVYLIQPENVDGSGVYSLPDFQNAIQSIRSYSRITDLCLLNFNDGLADLMEENVMANDPFQRRPNLLWAGAPIGTPIGDETTVGSLVYMAQQQLAVPGQSAAKGTRIMIAPTTAQMTIVLDSGLSSQVTLDGSFLALAAASRVASFTDPATDMLGTQINGFDTIQIYGDEQNAILGQAQVLYALGSPGVYTWGEDYTVDSAAGFERVQLMTQRQFVTKVVIRNMASLIGITPASGEAAKALIRGQLSSILRGLLSQGLIAPYQDDSGNERAFDPNADIIVFQDEDDLTLFYFNYAWFSRNVIKRLLGLYSLNSNDFSTGVALT